MPMLHSCSFVGCNTRTLSTYCLEHEVQTRARTPAERMRASSASDEPVTAEAAELAARPHHGVES